MDIIQNTKTRIIESAKKLFSDNNYLSVSMSDIAKRLKLTKASLYYHFTGKTELYKEILDGVFKEFKKTLSPVFKEKDPRKKFYLFFKRYFEFAKKEKILIKTIYSKTDNDQGKINTHIIDLKQKMNLEVEKLLKDIIKEKKSDYSLLSSLFIGMMDGILNDHSIFNRDINSKKLSKKILNFIFPRIDSF